MSLDVVLIVVPRAILFWDGRMLLDAFNVFLFAFVPTRVPFARCVLFTSAGGGEALRQLLASSLGGSKPSPSGGGGGVTA